MTDAARVQPHDHTAEDRILGTILLRGESIVDVSDQLRSTHFDKPANRCIYQHMLDLAAHNVGIDLVTLRESLKRANVLKQCGDVAYLTSLTDDVIGSPAQMSDWAAIVRRKHDMRAIIAAAQALRERAFDEEQTPGELVAAATQTLSELAQTIVTARFHSVASLLHPMLDHIERMRAADGISGIATGFTDLDAMLSGLQRTDLVIVAARPSHGKTSLALNIGTYVARTLSVAMFSIEMSKEQLMLRIAASEARIGGRAMRRGMLTERDYARLAAAYTQLSDLRLEIDDSATLTVEDIRARARRLQLEQGLDVIIVDYIQLMSTSRRYDSRVLELGAITRGLKAIAKDLNVVVIALSQLSRGPETRGDHVPQLYDLRESGNIEQDADVALLLWRPEMYDENDRPGYAEAIVAKQRMGPVGMTPLCYIADQTRFANLAPGYVDTEPATEA